jgi:hypothetical protein
MLIADVDSGTQAYIPSFFARLRTKISSSAITPTPLFYRMTNDDVLVWSLP